VGLDSSQVLVVIFSFFLNDKEKPRPISDEEYIVEGSLWMTHVRLLFSPFPPPVVTGFNTEQ
jgi:hypothetical protein